MKLKGGKAGSGGGMAILIVPLLISVAVMGVVSYYVGVQDGYDKEYIGLLGEQRVLSQQITKYAGQAMHGNVETFKLLKAYTEQFGHDLQLLEAGDPETGMPPASDGTVFGELNKVQRRWVEFNNASGVIVKGGSVVSSLREKVATASDNATKLVALLDETTKTMIEANSPRDEIYRAGRQLMLGQRIISNVNLILGGDAGAVRAADRLSQDTAEFDQTLQEMLNGDKKTGAARVSDDRVRAKLKQAEPLFADFKAQIDSILGSSPEMFGVYEAVQTVLRVSEPLLGVLTSLEKSYVASMDSRWLTSRVSNAFGLVALVLLVLLGFRLKREGEHRIANTEQERRSTEEANQRNQQAIMRLLDEMGDLADGDLTVNATVTEDITGAIADSVNYAIEALRTLVTAINDTANQVTYAAEQTRATASHLTEASEQQAREISSASRKIREMALSVEGVSKNADLLAEESQRSVEFAKRGAEAVRNTIHGMDTIREQIQETSKRIKRLGESSQEIGDIVELINDIAEQTNILALNAAIQAAMAGEAGRGFAVVADEVQRLAERSADATKQIEALVKTIQTDTNEAVISMEQSTSGVVAGAKLAEGANSALGEIENVATRLAELVHSISDATRDQAEVAVDITDTMNVIQEITTQTSNGTNQTAAAIGNLAELASELKGSVSGFKLPS